MAKLTFNERQAILVLLYTRNKIVGFDEPGADFVEFFREIGVDINSPLYQGEDGSSLSQSDRLKNFLEKEDDEKKLGEAIYRLVDNVECIRESGEDNPDIAGWVSGRQITLKSIRRCKEIARKKLGQKEESPKQKPKDIFAVFESARDIDFSQIPIEEELKTILKERFDEAAMCFDNGMYLSAIIMGGSILEGMLLGYAKQNPEKFNQSKSCYKDSRGGKPFPFTNWSLAQLIDAAKEIGLLDDDMKRFGHSMREYRNYIHPHEQLKADFKVSREKAHLCLQALIYALRDLMTE